MVDRLLLWLGAGVIAGGVTVGMLAGAGVAYGQTESDGDGGAKTSEPAKPADNQPDSGKAEAGQNQQPDRNNKAVDAPDATVDREPVRKAPKSEAGKRTATLINNVVAAITHKPDRKVTLHKTDPVEKADPVEKIEPAAATDPVVAVEAEPRITRLFKWVPSAAKPEPTPAAGDPIVISTRAPPTESNITLATPLLSRSDVTASAAPQLQVPPVVSAIGTAVFGLISFAESVFEGPPKALPGSGVTVERSTLDLGNGHVVPADWYFPDSETPPERIIYLQHGFLARGVFYDYTASYLAKETNSIVVAPTLTSNIFATDGMWLGGEQMHRAVADLFLDGNPALLEERTSGRISGRQELPQEVVLVGHSLGGGLVIDTARLMAADEADNKSSYKLAGVLMLDGVSFTDPVPILDQISGWHPGVQPVGHAVSVEPVRHHGCGSCPGTRRRLPRGAAARWPALGLDDRRQPAGPVRRLPAHRLLAADEHRGLPDPCGRLDQRHVRTGTEDLHRDRVYGEPGDTLNIPTGFGPAIGLVQPKPGVVDTLARQVTAVFFGLLGSNINFATDVPETEQTSAFQEISA